MFYVYSLHVNVCLSFEVIILWYTCQKAQLLVPHQALLIPCNEGMSWALKLKTVDPIEDSAKDMDSDADQLGVDTVNRMIC